MIALILLATALNLRGPAWISRPSIDDLTPSTVYFRPAGAMLKANVSTSGRLENCKVLFASDHVDAAHSVCRRFETQARMKSAVDRDDKPIYSTTYIPVRFGEYAGQLSVPETVLTYDIGIQSARGTLTATLLVTISEMGEVESCEVIQSTKDSNLDQQACAAAPQKAGLVPLADQASLPVRSSQVVFVKFAPG